MDIVNFLDEKEAEEFNSLYSAFLSKYKSFELKLLLSNPEDEKNVILEIHSGAGGTEVTEGKLRIVVDSVSLSVKNGNYIA